MDGVGNIFKRLRVANSLNSINVDTFESQPGACVLKHAGSFVVVVKNALDADLCRPETMNVLRAVGGRYWQIGELNGYPIFKLDDRDRGDDEESLFLVHTKDGWWMTHVPAGSRFWDGLKARCGDGEYPSALHYPPKAKKAIEGVAVKPYAPWAEDQVNELLMKCEEYEEQSTLR